MKEHYGLLVEEAVHSRVEPPYLHTRSSFDIPQGKQALSPVTRQLTTLIIGWILRCGVIFSAAITFTGMLLLIARSGGIGQTNLQFFPHTLGQVGMGLIAMQPQAIIALGLLLLIATPVISVTASVVGFALEHDRRYVVIALIVLTTLITSFLLGKGG